jgi:hypothetical protein
LFKQDPEIIGIKAGQSFSGKDNIPAPTVEERREEPPNTVPGPFAYAPEYFASVKGNKPSAFSIRNRIRNPTPKKMPAPNEHYIPS